MVPQWKSAIRRPSLPRAPQGAVGVEKSTCIGFYVAL
jgi:hypothetical protein